MLAIALVIYIAVQSSTPALAAVTGKQKVNGLIMFPESVEMLDMTMFSAKQQSNEVLDKYMSRLSIDYDKDVPPSCKGQTYCTIKTDDYPEQKFNDMFKGYNAFPQPQLLLNPLQNKQGDPNEKNDCESQVSFDPLYKVRENKNKPWRYVIQAPDHDYVQRVRLERCLNTNSSCFTKFKPLFGYGTHCKQTNTVWEVLVAKGDNQSELIRAELPVCCSCTYAKKH